MLEHVSNGDIGHGVGVTTIWHCKLTKGSRSQGLKCRKK